MQSYTEAYPEGRWVEEFMIRFRKESAVERPKKVCSCGDPKCTKKTRRRNRRPISQMGKVEPIVKSRLGDDAPVEFDENGELIGDISPEIRKQVEKALKGKSISNLYSMGLGLPSRVRRYVKKVWKLQDREGRSWEDISNEMTSIAGKILDNRIEVITYAGIAATREGTMDPAKALKLAKSLAEADALLTIFSHLFLPGVSAALTGRCVTLAEGGTRGNILGGVVDIVDFANFDSSARRKRRSDAERGMKSNNWKLPRRDYK